MFRKLKKAYNAIKSDTGVFYLYPSFTTAAEVIEKKRANLKRLGKTNIEIAEILERKRPMWEEHLK